MRILNFCRKSTDCEPKSKQDRKDFMREYNKKYREEHSEVVKCECGAEYKEISKYNHYGSARHLEHINRSLRPLLPPPPPPPSPQDSLPST